MKCLNVIVFFDNKKEVESYVTEVVEKAFGMVDIAVVVNSDKCNSIICTEKKLRDNGIECFKVYNYGENIGYLNAMLKVIKEIDVSQYDYIILSNTDIHYESEDFFPALSLKKYQEGIGCIAPCVFAPQSNSYSNPHYSERISKKKLERNVKIFNHPLLAKIYLKLSDIKVRSTRAEKRSSCFVYSPHGCYMIFTRTFIERIIGYEYGVKLYSEESAIGELLIRNNMKCYYDDSICVTHQESSVTGTIDYRKRFSAWKESIQYILSEFY